MILRLVFKLGQKVYRRADQDCAGIITGFIERPYSTAYQYFVSWSSDGESIHYESELQADRDFKTGSFSNTDD